MLKIRALVKTSHKRLNAFLAPGVKKLSPLFLALKLGEFSLFNNIFLDLANFWDLDNFSLFDFLVFSFICLDLLLSSMAPISLTASTLVHNNLLDASTWNNMVIFNIDVSSMAILLKL